MASIIKAEYMVMSHSTKEAICLKQLMEDVRCIQDNATPVMYNNQGSMCLAKNPTHHSSTKLIHVQYHFIQEKLEIGVIELKYCPT